jgi:hypothetical protein
MSELTDNQEIEATELAIRAEDRSLLIPASEVEIAESIRENQAHVGSPVSADVLRRLAFQRDRWRDEIRETIRILNWNGHTTAIRKLEMLLGDKS